MMYTKSVAISMFTVFLLAGLLGVTSAEIEIVNGTDNISEIGNISGNETNESFLVDSGNNNSSTTNITDNAGSSGGIRSFMKSFKFQSSV